MLSSDVRNIPFGRGSALTTARRAMVTAAVLARHTARGATRARRSNRSEVAAHELRSAFEELGPTYVKLGQLVASSPGLFPDVLASEFRACLDSVPPVPAREVHALLATELGASAGELFASFDEEPLASASIAQVHAATLLDGTDVVVKIQRPGLAHRLGADMAILRRIASALDRMSATGRMANPVAVVEDFTVTLAQELNFVIEARAMERFAANLTRFGTNDTVRVPTVHWPLTTPRVLTMERIHGYKIDDLAALGTTGWDLAGALKAGVRAWMEAALVHGFFHGDVHAGNLMVDTDGRVVFLDFGICGALDDATRQVVCEGLPALLVDRDFKRVASAIYDLGAILSPTDLEQSARDIAELVTPILERPLSEISYGEVLIDIIRIGTRYEVRLPRELVLVAKQLLYFERYAKLMAPDWTILDDPELIAFLFDATVPIVEERAG
jgi:predicted unusual protein kinase regulating ubiquinone biosynthesis (AarF/ABC1/UbiB family)